MLCVFSVYCLIVNCEQITECLLFSAIYYTVTLWVNRFIVQQIYIRIQFKVFYSIVFLTGEAKDNVD